MHTVNTSMRMHTQRTPMPSASRVAYAINSTMGGTSVKATHVTINPAKCIITADIRTSAEARIAVE
jgi:hypothetical protein